MWKRGGRRPMTGEFPVISHFRDPPRLLGGARPFLSKRLHYQYTTDITEREKNHINSLKLDGVCLFSSLPLIWMNFSTVDTSMFEIEARPRELLETQLLSCLLLISWKVVTSQHCHRHCHLILYEFMIICKPDHKSMQVSFSCSGWDLIPDEVQQNLDKDAIKSHSSIYLGLRVCFIFNMQPFIIFSLFYF